MKRWPLVFGTIVATLPAVVFAQMPVAIAGHTAASPQVVAKIHEGLTLIAPIWLRCSHVDSVTAGAVPDGFDPKAAVELPESLVPAPKGPIRFELWTIGGCDRSTGILVRLWYTDAGNEQFSLSPLKALGDGS